MPIRLIVIALTAIAAIPAAADFKTIVKAYEVSLSDLRLPANESGRVAFKACDGCAYQTVSVNDATEYEANDRLYELAEFRRELSRVARKDQETATVLHHLETDTVTAIRVKF